MKDFLIFIPLTILYLAFKSTILAGLALPDMTLLAVFYVAYRRPSAEGAVLAFVLGYIDDVLTGGVIGSTSFAFLLVFLAIHFLSRRVHFTTPAMRAAGAGVLSLFKSFLVYIILSFAGMDAYTLLGILFQAFLTAVFAPAVISVFSWLTALVTPRTFEG